MEKNKKIILIGMIVLAIITIIISLIFIKPEEKEKNNNEKEIRDNYEYDEEYDDYEEDTSNKDYFEEKNLLVQKITINSIDYTTKGTFILTDGSIYTYIDDGSSSNKGDSLESMIENSTKLDKKVSYSDLYLIKDDIDDLEDEKETKEKNNYDSVSTTIEVYDRHGPIIIKSTGYSNMENTTIEGQELLRIINKYID